ncbi:hypothetical protein VTJ83DRAFT_7478 [Remersonia thermophila]|uniref:SWR1-complex protein 4 n=1 Tax=Remersonia thermophila TaxID=72144 RepID=A0ABR4D3M3_9PEZI
MASNDLRDVLNLPSDSSTPRPAKKQKTAGPRPNLKGLAREVQNLGGDNPIAIVPEVSFYKKRRFASRKPAARWELRPFTNSARNDDGALVLRHWRRKTDHGPQADALPDGPPAPDAPGDDKPEDSAFAKFNVKVSVPEYTDDQYKANLQNNDWTKEETDYLMELCRDFDLRWAVIWDRYDYAPEPPPDETGGHGFTAVMPAPRQRSMEDLKARYYEVAAKMMAVHKPAQYMTRPEFELYEMMQNFNPEQERRRKEFALNTMARSRDEAREEESLLLEIKRIMARTERFNEERRELYNRLDFPATDKDIASFKSSAGLQTLLQNLMSTDKSKKRNAGPESATTAAAAAATTAATATSGGGGGNRRESVAASSSRRESDARGPATSAEPTPTTAASATAPSGSTAAAHKKKGSAAQQPERRKLSAQEEQVYGVSYHDRLGSGPTFRYERINKLYSHKSGQQQLRMTNALAELDVPPRLVMPTAAVTAQFEQLWGAVTTLVDLRKVSDKLDAEIRLEEAKKAEREKAKAAAEGKESGNGGEEGAGGKDKEGEKKKEEEEGKEKEAEAGEKKEEKDGEKPQDGTGTGTGTGADKDGKESDKANATGGDAAPEGAEASKAAAGDAPADGGGGSGAADADADAASIKEEDGAAETAVEEGDGEGEKTGHKRSASVLSAGSDKSSKRLKK